MKTNNPKSSFLFSTDSTHVSVAYLIKKYNEVGSKALGRTILQKLCYFAAASGVPLPFHFQIHHYGPFSQKVFEVVEDLEVDGVIRDMSAGSGTSDYRVESECDELLRLHDREMRRYKPKLDAIARTFYPLGPTELELVSTIHYIHSAHRQWFKKKPPKGRVVNSVHQIKGQRFPRSEVSKTYDVLSHAGLLS